MGAELLYLIKGGLFVSLLLAASVIDIRKRIIPNTVCLLIAATGLILFEPVRLAGCLSALPLLLAALLWGGMGGGDIKLAASSGIVLGFTGSMAAIAVGLAAMLLFCAGYAAAWKLRRRECQKSFPLAPFLSIGYIAVYFMNTGGIDLWVF